MPTIVCQHCHTHLPHNTLPERLWNQVDRGSPSRSKVGIEKGCWEWIGPTNQKGYGTGGNTGYGYLGIDTGKKKRGKKFYAHRLAWELTNGSIPDGLSVCHKCDNRLCCNPDHLFLGTHQDNMTDMVKKDRQRRKVSDETINNIVAQYATGHFTYQELADMHRIGKTHISRIVRDKLIHTSLPPDKVELCATIAQSRPNVKRLDPQQVAAIRSHSANTKKYGLTKRLAEQYGVDRSVIYRIMHDETYVV